MLHNRPQRTTPPLQPSPPEQPADEMGFFDHLEALRWHLIRALAAVLGVSIVFLSFKDLLFNHIIFAARRDDFVTYRLMCWVSKRVGLGDGICYRPPQYELQVLGVGEPFILHLQLSFIMGFMVAFPYVLWEIWRFVSPALYERERLRSRWLVLACTLLFALGTGFGYFVVTPFAINWLVTYQIPGVQNIPTVTSYINYELMLTLPLGLVFQLPVAVYFMAGMGLLTPATMRYYRKHAFVVILVVAAFITPSPDMISQMIVGFPVYLLYEVSIGVAARQVRRLAARG